MRVRWLNIAAPFSLLVLWQVAVSTRLLNPGLFPPPTAIAANFVAYAASGELATNALWTLSRLMVGLVIGGIPGTIIGLLMGMNRYVRAYFQPVIALLYPIPKIAILPLFYFIFGTGEAAKWAAVAVGVFFLMAINTEAGVRQIETIYLDVARAYRIRPVSFFFRVLLPGALPNIYAGLKLSIGIAIVLAVAAEYQLTRVGLGFAIFNAQQLLDVERLYAALVAVSLLGFALAAIVDAVEMIALPWRRHRRA
ncbi:nitrate ABC transporter permease [Vulcanimicrobium alpinum]|uniref:Nitrate ABC transporter permease n=1 Tax=Vulcanimicrobium alpinum TaxID=3016050 RepID=A0AAN1XVY5_UNVUL|nr:ABC transporter permease [Vulcanimicrobium alpinum]BDE05994.1 nitrate ABC transporter permease [Vulcanimicrobium alpinum]